MKRRSNSTQSKKTVTVAEHEVPRGGEELEKVLHGYLASAEKYHKLFNPKQLTFAGMRAFFAALIFFYWPANSWYHTQLNQGSQNPSLLLASAIIISILTSLAIAVGTVLSFRWVIHGTAKPSENKAYLKRTTGLLKKPAGLKVVAAEIKYDIDVTLDRLGTMNAFFTSAVILPIAAFYFAQPKEFEIVSRLIPVWGAFCLVTVRLLCMRELSNLRRWLVLVERLQNE
ncbi:MAG: hypothetical protein ABW250_16995 [Pyrinomonadaceae bacterium]